MTPAFYGLDGRSLSTRVANLVALAASSAGQPTTLLRIAYAGGPDTLYGTAIAPRLRSVERTTSRGGLSIVVDELLTSELLDGRFVVLDLPGDALGEPGLMSRPDVVRIVPVGPCAIDAVLSGAPGTAREVRPTSDGDAPLRFLSCGLATGVPDDEGGRLGNAGRGPDRVGGAWLGVGFPALPGGVWDDVARGSPAAGVLALGQALLRDLGGPAPEMAPTASPEILAARLWGLAMDVQAYESGLAPTAEDLERAPVINDWRRVERGVPALAGRFEGHPYIRDGARSITSDIFHTDGRTYARTLSRLYRLGRPAAVAAPATTETWGTSQ